MRNIALLLFAVAAARSQPIIYAVENAASNIPQLVSFGVAPTFANGSLAQGAMFVVKGVQLGPASVVVANSYPLTTTLAGTSIQVVIAGKTTDAILYYTESQQVAAILPSTTPLGLGFLSVTYNGHTNSFPINVVQNNVAMYTLGQTGAGDAVVTLADGSIISPNNAPNPGDVIVFWANGLGPVASNETMPATDGDMTSVPLEVFIGGLSAKVLYRGRNACCVSLDQINAQIPQGVPTGCVVSVVMRIGSLVSNTATIPIASSGRLCTPTNPAISQTDLQRLLGQSALSVGVASLGRIMQRSLSLDGLGANFRRFSALASLLFDAVIDVPAPGSCTVTYEGSGGDWNDPTRAFSATGLDAGSSIVVTGANSVTTLTGGPGNYGINAPGQYLDPGPETIKGSGGADVGAFQVSASVPPPFVWTNPGVGATIDRTQGVTVTWSGADPSGYITVSGYASRGVAVAFFACTGRASDGSLTVPSFVLEGLPAPSNGFLQIEGVSRPVQFSAVGLDLGLAWASEWDSISVQFK